ncbi:MAG: hypothetical protein P4L57_06480 [Rhizomicrobium sp.]|nr:hypothetical protein [Rhizomicrobium sp.]
MIRLPSRYEDLDTAFRGRLKPNQSLLEIVKRAFASMEISGGIRFLPVFGQSGSGKTSAALEIGTHLPELYVDQLPREAVEDATTLKPTLDGMLTRAKGRRLVAVVDQYEEVAAQRTAIPSTFVETLSLLDRDHIRSDQILFIWLTTSKEFQSELAAATSRNKRILVDPAFEVVSIDRDSWPAIIQETFQFHNQEKALSDYEILEMDLGDICSSASTLGAAIEDVGAKLAVYATTLHDLSNYLVVMLWPVTDGLRISRVQQFTDPRQGYKLDWNAWYRQLNSEDQAGLPLREYNRARLYFDVRLVPIAAADIHPLCRDLTDDSFVPGHSYLDRFKSTHFYSIVSGNWSPENFAPLRERESKRADDARAWYPTVTLQPTALGKRLAKCLRELNLPSDHEQTISSPYSKVRADILIDRSPIAPSSVIVELKAFSAENTMPSTIAASVLTTLRRHAQFAGFLPRQ